MNLPNRLTIARLILTAFFVAAMTSAWRRSEGAVLPVPPSGWAWGYTAGLVLFISAAATDYFDGQIARHRNLVTDFGKLMDPLADKVLMAAAFICLVPEHAIPSWAVIVIISREFLITGLRLLAASKGVVLPADKLGKHKTAWQVVTVIYFLTLLSVMEMERAGWLFAGTVWAAAWNFGGPVLITIAVALTLYSGFGYVWKNRTLVSKEAM